MTGGFESAPTVVVAGGAVGEQQDYKRLATALADVARILLAQDSPQETLDQIVQQAVRLVDGCEAAGIMVVRRKEAATLAATDETARESDRAQIELREGPCFDAALRHTPVYRVADMYKPQDRWPRYAERARGLGIGSMMGFLLYTVDEDNLGSLDLYSSRRDVFTEATEHVGWILASHAAVALSAARHAENLDHALTSSRMIGKAVGVVMSRYKLSEEEAFNRIRVASQHANIKIRDLADMITMVGEIPSSELAKEYLRRSR